MDRTYAVREFFLSQNFVTGRPCPTKFPKTPRRLSKKEGPGAGGITIPQGKRAETKTEVEGA